MLKSKEVRQVDDKRKGGLQSIPRAVLRLPHERTRCVTDRISAENDPVRGRTLCVTGGDSAHPA